MIVHGCRVSKVLALNLTDIKSGHSSSDILKAYPYLEEADIYEALAYAAWRAEEIEVPLISA